MREEDIATFVMYSSRIKTLCLTSPPSHRIEFKNTSIFPRLGPIPVLFPSLVDLIDHTEDVAQTDFVLRTAGEGLRRVETSCYPTPSFLSAVQNKAVGLVFLSLYLEVDGWEVAESLRQVLRISNKMETLNLTLDFEVNDSIWESILQLRALTDLTLDFDSAPSFNCLKSVTFSTLVRLTFLTPKLHFLLDLMQSSKFPCLQSLNCLLVSSKLLTPEGTASVVRAIAKACSPACLENVRLAGIDQNSRDFAVQSRIARIHGDAIRPLLRFSRIRTFQLNTQCPWDFDDDIIRDIAESWPKVGQLGLDPFDFYAKEKLVTLQGLEPLVEKCQHLTQLMVAIDCTVPCPRNATLVDKRNDSLVEERGIELPAGGKQNFSLDSLNFGCSIIGSEPEAPMRLAAYLSGVFPKLRAIRFEVPQGVSSQERSKMEEQWKIAEDALMLFRRAREEERLRFGIISEGGTLSV